MNPDLQHQLVLLLGALTLGVPLTAPHVPKWIDAFAKARASRMQAEGDAKRTSAETDKLEAETAASAFADLRHRLDECERKHQAADAKIAILLEKFAEKMERDEVLIRGMRAEMDSLRAEIRSGGRRHA